jgi:3-methyladenine DNA glycosylase Tag
MDASNNAINCCPWCGNAADYQEYPDKVWGRPVYDSHDLFAKLCLDGQQAGFNFVGPTIIYAFMQAAGMVNDHLSDCDFRNVE